ncbi:MAG: hypothetical protein ACTHM8_12135 [Sphingomonas sp.]
MMPDLDQRLHDLATMPTPSLDGLEHEVIARIHDLADADRRMPGRMVILAAFAATALGIAGAGLPLSGAAPAQAASFDGAQLAPSHLLMGDQ